MTGIASGEHLGDAVVRIARDASLERFRGETQGLFYGLVEDSIANPYGCLGTAVFLNRDGFSDSALEWFGRAGHEVAALHAAPEYADALFTMGQTSEAVELSTTVLRDGTPLSPAERWRVLEVLAKHRSVDLLRERLAALSGDEDSLAALTPKNRSDVAWMIQLLNAADDRVADVEGAVHIAVMDYKILDPVRTSGNRGDYVQTLAALSHVLRFTGVNFVGDGPLTAYLNDLRQYVHPDRHITDVSATVVPVVLDRDFASNRTYPANTWLICNGWFMRRAFKGPLDFPFPAEVNPIMISFHIQEPDVLSDEVVEALRAYEPIGCRDWTSVYRLRDVGVSAFFSGCVTTTVGQILDPAAPQGLQKLADVEGRLAPTDYPGWSRQVFSQVGEHVRVFDVVEGIEDCRQMLNGYAGFDKVVTLRLHCYVPARSMGLDVDFRPPNRSDIRFEGLLDLTPEAFTAIRTGIDDKLEVMLREILSGASREDVYATWRRITADDVAAADEYCRNYPEHIPSNIDVPSTVAEIAATRTTFGEVSGDNVVDLAFALDQNMTEQFLVVLESVAEHTDRPLRAHILGRGLTPEYYERVHRLFPQMQCDFYDLTEVAYGEDVALLSHNSVSTMDRLFLPELLSNVDRIVYLDVDVLVRGDVGELFDTDLRGNVIAAKRTRLRTWANLVRPVTRGSLHLPPEKAWLMRRRLHATGKLTTRAFNAGVLVLNLAIMRDEHFTAENLHLVESCYLNAQDVLNVYSHDRVVELDSAWNVVPSQESERDPRIIHWAGPAKPWKQDYVPFRDRFRDTAASLSAREAKL